MTFEQQKNTKALSITIGVHLLLLLISLFARYSMPSEPPAEAWGMEVNLGTVDNAYGVDQPELKDNPAAPDNIVATHAVAPDKSVLKDIQTTDKADAPAVNIAAKQLHKENKPTANAAKAAKITTKQKPKYIFAGSSGKGGNSAEQNKDGGNEGIGQGTGDMGVPGGTPGAKNYRGMPGNGNMSYSLNNRVLVERPDPKAVYQKGGKVIVKVTVNRNGDIINYQITRAAYPELRDIVVRKLKQVKFNKAPNARPEEFGTITFDFASVAN